LAGVSGWLPIDARFAAKKELERIPVFGRAWRACGHISIDRANRASAIESMTRAGLGPFVTAIEGGVPIVPVGLVGSRAIMPKGSFRIRRGAIVVRVGEPISVVGMKHADRDRLRDTVWDAVAQLRGGEGRTCCLPGEPPLDHVPEPSSLNSDPS